MFIMFSFLFHFHDFHHIDALTNNVVGDNDGGGDGNDGDGEVDDDGGEDVNFRAGCGDLLRKKI